MKKIILISSILLILMGVGVYLTIGKAWNMPGLNEENSTIGSTQKLSTEPAEVIIPEKIPEVVVEEPFTVIGQSVEDRDIVAYHYGEGDTELLFVGGIHGGYEWNTVLVAYEMMDYLEGNPDIIPEDVKVTIVPVLNPDGLHKVVGTADRFAKADVPSTKETIPGRFNANGVDLNRNFDCDWQTTGTWQDTPVDGGSEVFSEPESQAIKLYVEAHNLEAAVVWYSSANGVFSSNCHNGVLPETNTLTNVYADASGYPAYEVFDYYEVTGDMVNWLAKKNIPAISILLATHENVEWSQNKAGIDAILNHYAE